jgi:endonuclease YncB( thermonuclease family)
MTLNRQQKYLIAVLIGLVATNIAQYFHFDLQGFINGKVEQVKVSLGLEKNTQYKIPPNLPLEKGGTGPEQQSIFVAPAGINIIGDFTVSRIVDGDTAHVKSLNAADMNKEDVVRIMAVNTLEKMDIDARVKCMAYAATDFTKEKLLNKKVALYSDSTQPARDKYNRLLAYVLIDGESVFYNETLILEGLAKVYRASPPAIEYSKYLKIQEEQIKLGKGIWGQELCKNL